MENIIKTIPQYGDIVVLKDGKKRFIPADADSSFVEQHACIGVVYDVQGKLVRIVGGVNNQSKKWSAVADYRIDSVPSASGDYAVVTENTARGNFHYTRSAGTPAEFATQLNTWCQTNLPKWEAYTEDGVSYFQKSTYDEYESTVSIAGTTLTKLVGLELAPYTLTTGGRNHAGQYTPYNGMNRARIEAYCKDNTSASCNPTSRLNGTTQLFVTYPVSQAYYNGSLGDGLRANFATYSDYLDACMVIPQDMNKGIMQFRDGKMMTSLLKDKQVLVHGVRTYAYQAARHAYEYDAVVDGFGGGTWWLPSMYELALLMAKIGSSDNRINVALSKKSGWSQIGITSFRWSCCRYSTSNAWSYNGNGVSNYNYFCYGLAVSAVSAFILDD